MPEKIIPQEDISQVVLLDISGDIHLSGWNREEIRLKDSGEEVQHHKKKTTLEISSQQDLVIKVPHQLEIKIKSIGGDVAVKGMRGELEVKSVSGDLTVSDVSTLTASAIAGDLIASRIQGNLQANSIGGDSLIDNVQGQVGLKGVGGDFFLESVAGGIDAIAGGDGRADFHPVPWQAYRMQVGGDLALTLPADASADLSIESGASDITIFPGKLDITSSQDEFDYTLGEGGPSVSLTAGGKVFIIDNEFTVFTGIKENLGDLGTLAAGFSADTSGYIRDHLDNLEVDLQETLSGLSESLKEIGLSEEKLQNLKAQIKETSRRAAEKAEVAAIKAQAKVEKKIAKARRRALQAREMTKQFDINKFLEEQSREKAVSDSERMLILEMLQEKKITPEEAEELLSALEGKRK